MSSSFFPTNNNWRSAETGFFFARFTKFYCCKYLAINNSNTLHAYCLQVLCVDSLRQHVAKELKTMTTLIAHKLTITKNATCIIIALSLVTVAEYIMACLPWNFKADVVVQFYTWLIFFSLLQTHYHTMCITIHKNKRKLELNQG